MEAKIKMRMENQKSSSYELQVPFINVLPREPNQAYKRFNYQQLQAIKKTQRIPFSSIRQLILMYVLQNQEVIDVPQSELFKEKLMDQNYSKDYAAVNQVCDQLLKEKGRLEKLHEVTHKYIEKRQKLVSNQLRRTLHKRYDRSELTNLLGKLEQTKDKELKDLQKRVEQASKSKIRIDIEAQKMQIQQGYNKKVLSLFEEQLPNLQKLSTQFHQNFENVNWFKLYIDDFEKSLVFIISVKKINKINSQPNKKINKINRQPNKKINEINSQPNEQQTDERILKEYFQIKLQAIIQQLGKYLDQELEQLFQWTSKVKYRSAELRQNQVKDKRKSWIDQIHKIVYDLIPDIISILTSDKQRIKNVEDELARQYAIFLPGFYDAKEVALFYKKQSKIEEILQNQRHLLIDHLKKNYSMMVFYSKSPEYMSCIEQYKSKSKGYLKDILKKKIGLLDVAINFINKEYGQLYKQACDNRSGIREKINSKCRSLEQSLKENQIILTLILESCRRLLNIVSK